MGPESNENERSGELFDGLPLPAGIGATTAKAAAAKKVADAPVRVILPKRERHQGYRRSPTSAALMVPEVY